jgi:hypothetical protein
MAPRTWMRDRLIAGSGSSDRRMPTGMHPVLLPPPANPRSAHHAHAATKSLI